MKLLGATTDGPVEGTTSEELVSVLRALDQAVKEQGREVWYMTEGETVDEATRFAARIRHNAMFKDKDIKQRGKVVYVRYKQSENGKA